ncbi:phosphoribosyl 1,2-cyclic phosphodiesterase [Flavobacterium sp. 2755]|uniref:MBL fold metallo-hydrolase n=1 Tax=Flavobacterium sp. 2755 TaxID=2817765 RepID=UPI002865FC5E|nr:MBL fold metallo-hydrolase [Flavobacterium sp. 2755]MDR6761920.1 phosphoribosyl 1,2-cyclic phosphodiesterase [Flavobacterium sp. 2755]
MKTLRIFHSAGQGAFYSEVHQNTGSNSGFTIVFDFGSLTLKDKKLELLVSSAFRKKHIIDILFISHFHTDHVNGLDFLKKNYRIKKVVLPLLDDTAKILMKISNFINYGILFGN